MNPDAKSNIHAVVPYLNLKDVIEDIPVVTSMKVCGSCFQDWGTPTMTCRKLEDPTKDHLDLVINTAQA